MAYTLNSTSIRPPSSLKESNSTQLAQNRTLSGAVTRDYFGSNKKVWILEYKNLTKTDFDILNTIYQSYLTTGTAKSWAVSETNYTVSSTTVHVDLLQRDFSIPGTDYISNCSLILTEA